MQQQVPGFVYFSLIKIMDQVYKVVDSVNEIVDPMLTNCGSGLQGSGSS